MLKIFKLVDSLNQTVKTNDNNFMQYADFMIANKYVFEYYVPPCKYAGFNNIEIGTKVIVHDAITGNYSFGNLSHLEGITGKIMNYEHSGWIDAGFNYSIEFENGEIHYIPDVFLAILEE